MRNKLMNLLKELFRVTVWKRRAFFLLADTLIITFSLYAGFWLRFDGKIPEENIVRFPFYLLIALAVKLILLQLFGMYGFSWRFFSVLDLARLTAALTLSSIILAAIFLGFRSSSSLGGMPRSVLLVDFVISLAMMTGLRISKRIYREYLSKRDHLLKGRARVLIIGAGEAGNSVAQEMLRNPKSGLVPVGFIDDEPAKRGLSINGIKVLGTRHDVEAILKNNHIDEILIAIPSASSREIRGIVEIIRQADPKKRIRILPGILDLVDGRVGLADVKEVKVDDLLGREQVSVDFEKIRAFIRGRCVLVTGAGGSIGSELVRTVLQFEPSKLLALDIDETELFYLANRLKEEKGNMEPMVADIRDRAKMTRIFSECRPQVIIHSAAYKHVPMLEEFPEEAIKTNVLGTKILAELAIEFGAEKFVNISTDKAINPTSVMGSSKRIGEELLRVMNRRNGTRFISVRFGNVLGSRGSVIPVFEEQIRRGEPVTVTHPEMKRYFMATSEAVILVLQAAASGEGGEVFILDMGEPIKIVDLAREMIRLSGYEPDVDIPIIFTGMRPGEKLFEELLGAEEGSEPTEHPKIFKARHRQDDYSNDELREQHLGLLSKIDQLIAMSMNSANRDEIIGLMREIVPTYRPMKNGDTIHIS
ncbi:MAG: polysaccharide biosynthesis protein [Candidatus Saccharicenans sp.]